MIANLYNYGGDPRVVDKTAQLGLVTSVECEFFGEYDLINPSFKLNYSGINFNYIYVADLGRYYFVMDHFITNGQINNVRTKVDVLMSGKDAILNSNAQITRSGSGMTDIPDDKIPVLDQVWIDSKYLGMDYPSGNAYYALTVFGGA